MDAKRKHAKTYLLELGAIESGSTEYQSAEKAFPISLAKEAFSKKIFDDSTINSKAQSKQKQSLFKYRPNSSQEKLGLNTTKRTKALSKKACKDLEPISKIKN